MRWKHENASKAQQQNTCLHYASTYEHTYTVEYVHIQCHLRITTSIKRLRHTSTWILLLNVIFQPNIGNFLILRMKLWNKIMINRYFDIRSCNVNKGFTELSKSIDLTFVTTKLLFIHFTFNHILKYDFINHISSWICTPNFVTWYKNYLSTLTIIKFTK